jgi:hypothetical protein
MLSSLLTLENVPLNVDMGMWFAMGNPTVSLHVVLITTCLISSYRDASRKKFMPQKYKIAKT